MREIKFRAWDKKRQWITDVYIYNLHSLSEDIILIYPRIKNNTYVAMLEDVEIMQYTGLKDKNGKEIYEGDIIKCELSYRPFEKIIGKIIYDNKNSSFLLEVKQKNKDTPIFNISLFNIKNKEIISNIYENPKLLESK